MPRKSPLPESEIAICRRLKEVRTDAALSLVALCRALAEKPAVYANYERGKAKVPARVAWMLCEMFHVNQRWFATGEESKHPNYDLDPMLVPIDASKMPFSQVFQRFLRQPLETRRREGRRDHGDERPVSQDILTAAPVRVWDSVQALQYLVGMVETTAKMLPLSLHWKLFEVVVEAMRELKKKFAEEIVKHAQSVATGKGLPSSAQWKITVEHVGAKKIGVDNPTERQEDALVSLTWHQLKTRLKAATKPRGKRAEVARLLRTSDANITRWLNTSREPGAEATFRLLAWVTAEEAKQNGPSSAQAPPEPTTPKGTNQNESSKSKSRKRSHKPR